MQRAMVSLLLVIGCLGLMKPASAQMTTCPSDFFGALEAVCPCDGQIGSDGSVIPWKGHEYQRCAISFFESFQQLNCGEMSRRGVSLCTTHSTCGRHSAVVCCFAGRCNDPMQGDMVQAGTCSTDRQMRCDTDADCVGGMNVRLTHDADICAARGGWSAGAGSVCNACWP